MSERGPAAGAEGKEEPPGETTYVQTEGVEPPEPGEPAVPAEPVDNGGWMPV